MLQYRIELGVSGLDENTSCVALTTSERFDALRRRQAYSDKPKLQFVKNFPISGDTDRYVVSAGFFVRCFTDSIQSPAIVGRCNLIEVMDLTAEEGSSWVLKLDGYFNDVAVDPAQNLLVLLQQPEPFDITV